MQLVVAALEIGTGQATIAGIWWALPALLVGYIFGRMTHIAWEEERSQIALVGGQVACEAELLFIIADA